MRKVLRTAKIGRGLRPSPIWQSKEFFESNYFQIGQGCTPLPINYIASKNGLFSLLETISLKI